MQYFVTRLNDVMSKRLKKYANHSEFVLAHNAKFEGGYLSYEVTINHLSDLVGLI